MKKRQMVLAALCLGAVLLVALEPDVAYAITKSQGNAGAAGQKIIDKGTSFVDWIFGPLAYLVAICGVGFLGWRWMRPQQGQDMLKLAGQVFGGIFLMFGAKYILDETLIFFGATIPTFV